MIRQQIGSWLLATGLSAAMAMPALAAQPQVLASVGNRVVTAEDLRQALASSPFYTQFNSMDVDDQAAMRGDLLKRLVASRLLLEEAIALKMDQTPAFRKELEDYRKGLLYRRYMNRLRDGITLPDEVKSTINQELKGNADAQAAARSSYVAKQYAQLAQAEISSLREKYHVQSWEDRIQEGIRPNTVLLQGDGGLLIHYGDIVDTNQYSSLPDPLAVESELFKQAELELVAKAALDAGLDVSGEIESYREERLPALLMEVKTKAWMPDESALKAYYEQHPEFSKIPDQWLVGQIVLKTRAQADAVKQRIDHGESLFKLAGELSVDPYGKSRNGDMGWMIQGKGIPEIEKAIENLDNGQVSNIIQTPLGFHIVTVLDRKPGDKLTLTTVQDRIIQNIISQKRRGYLTDLQKKYKVAWAVMKKVKAAPPAPNG